MMRGAARVALLIGMTVISTVANAGGRCSKAVAYSGLGEPPSGAARSFGADLLSHAESSQRVVALDPGGRELFFTLIGRTGPQIMRAVFREGAWQAPERAEFSDVGVNAEPSFSPDGRMLYFVSNRPPSKGTDIWMVARSGEGWSAPVRLGDAVNSEGFEWHPQVTANGDLYFAAEDRKDSRGGADLYLARREGDGYRPAQNLGPSINTSAAEWDPYVSPGGTLLIFKSNRPGGEGGFDIYASVRKGDAWTPPRNLGPGVNSSDDEDTGEVTPDGRFLTFARSKAGMGFWHMYWIDMRALGLGTGAGRTCR